MPTSGDVLTRSGLRLSGRAAFWVQGSVLVLLMAASSAPSPLYPLYQARWGFQPVVLTVIFAAYVLALLAALLTAGTLSDYLGRRPVLMTALAVEIAAMVLFMLSSNEAALIIARLLQGIGTGAAVGALGAYLIELESSSRPGLGTTVNGAAPPVGLAIGAVASSIVAAAAPNGIQFIFLAILVLLVLQLAATAVSPETVTRRAGALASLRPRVHFPQTTRPAALWVLPAAAATWSLGGLILALGPSLVRSLAGPNATLLTGLIVAALTGTGGLATVLLGKARPPRLLGLGMAALVLGMAGTITALAAGSLVLYFAATIVAGIGFGAGFLGVLRMLLPQAEPAQRAGLLSAIYVVSYLSNSVPAVAAGALAGSVGLTTTAIAYSVMVMALSLVVLAGLAIRRQNPRAQHG